MSSFVDRLERELLEAARRQEQPRALRMPHLRLAPIAAAVAAAVLVVVVIGAMRGGVPEEREAGPVVRAVPVPVALQGAYTAGDVSLIIDPDRYTVFLGREDLRGDVSLVGDTLVFSADGSCMGRGRYESELRGRRLELVPLADSCIERREALSGSVWLKD